jgi:hypothetical protein
MFKIKLWTRLGAVAFVVSLLLSACYSYHDETYLDELDITLTYRDTSYNFQQNTTYALRDSVGIISDYLSKTEIANFYKSGGGNEKIKNLVRTNLNAMGYTEVANDEQYDLGVNLVVAAIENTTTYTYGWWYDYYDYYDYYWWGGWYPYYGYPWYAVSYTYQQGTLLMELADGNTIRAYRAWADGKTQGEIEHADPSTVPQIDYTWQGIVSGVAGTEKSYNEQRAERGINEAFTQSPYLKIN